MKFFRFIHSPNFFSFSLLRLLLCWDPDCVAKRKNSIFSHQNMLNVIIICDSGDTFWAERGEAKREIERVVTMVAVASAANDDCYTATHSSNLINTSKREWMSEKNNTRSSISSPSKYTLSSVAGVCMCGCECECVCGWRNFSFRINKSTNE